MKHLRRKGKSISEGEGALSLMYRDQKTYPLNVKKKSFQGETSTHKKKGKKGHLHLLVKE